MIKKFLGKESVFLIQNIFPVTEKYVDHCHIVNGKETRVIKQISNEIERKFKKLMKLTLLGKKVIFTDIKKDIEILLEDFNK